MQLSLFERLKRKLGHSVMLKPRFLRLEQGALSICFDDFPQSAWSIAGPILADHGVHATYFVSGGLCNEVCQGIKQFTDRDLQEVWSAGHEIGCHTYDHVNALKVSTRAFKESIDKNTKFFQERLGNVTIDNFAFPYNAATLQTKLLVGRRFNSGRGIGDRLIRGWSDFSELTSFNLSLLYSTRASQTTTRNELPLLMERAVKERKWLVVYTHDISDHPTEHGNRTRDFEDLILQAKQAGLAIKPIRDVIAG